MQYIERSILSFDWITLIVMGCILFFTIAKAAYPFRFQEFVKLPLTNKYLYIYGKNDPLYHPFNILLFIPQICSASLVLFLILKHFNIGDIEGDFIEYLQLIIAVLLFTIVKISFEKWIGYIVNVKSITNKYLFEKLSYRNFFSFLFLLFVTIHLFIVPFNTLGIIVFCSLIAVFNLIALVYSYKNHSNLIMRQMFYFILYLCALEISPYVIIYKLIT